MNPENYGVAIYPHTVPEFINEKLDELYQHMYSSYAYHVISESIDEDVHTYVANKDNEVIAAILFRIEGSTARVVTEQFRIQAEEIKRFCDSLFKAYPSLSSIIFPVVETTAGRLDLPSLVGPCTQDIVLTLPDTADSYLASLGKSTRSYVKRYLNKAKRDFPSISFTTYIRGEASEQTIRSIIELNRKRIEGKNQLSYIDQQETERIIKLVRLCGLIKVIRLNGEICAGTINFRFGENYFLKVIAHDPAYDAYGFGNLCCYLSICECIARKGKEYHFLWGKYEYKYRFMGVQKNLSTLVIYRSSAALVMNSGSVFKFYCRRCKHSMLDWAQSKARTNDSSRVLDRMAFQCLNNLKKLKRHIVHQRLH